MRISGIQIVDTYGCKTFKVAAFSVLRITGQNGTGKSSILRALSYLFEGGTDPSVIRKGADESVVQLSLDDGSKVVKTTRPKRARRGGEITGYVVDLEWTQPDGTPRPAPQTAINELGSALSVDPARLLRIDATTVPGRRALAAELLKVVHVEVTPEEVIRACSYRSVRDVAKGSEDAVLLEKAPDGVWGLADLKKATAFATEARRREGRVKDDTSGAINRLRGALPEGHAFDVNDSADVRVSYDGPARDAALRKSLDAAEDYRRGVEGAIAAAKLEVEKDRGATVAGVTATWVSATAAVNAGIDAQIKVLEALRAERNNAARAERDAAKEAADARARLALQEIDQQAAQELATAIENVGRAKDAIAQSARAATLREEIELQLKVYSLASWNYDEYSQVLQRLEALRLDKLRNLPVPGLVVEDDTPFLDGVEWQNVNLERRVLAVLQICTSLSGKVPLILWDDSEHADEANRVAIEAGLVANGYQVIAARVTDSPELCIETLGDGTQ